MGTATKHPAPDRVKPSLSVRVPRCQKLRMTAYQGVAQDAL